MTLTVGNKDDDPERKVVLKQDAQRFAEQMGIELFETSAKENINVEEVSFHSLHIQGPGPCIMYMVTHVRPCALYSINPF